MIFIKRYPAPECLTDERAAAAFAAINEHYSIPMAKRRQRVFHFDKVLAPIRRELTEAVMLQFKGKCAYCESVINSNLPGDIDWFRPRGGVSETDGEYLGDHYWRQAFDWENLYLACSLCDRKKGSRFPILGQRAPADASRASVLREQPLLLDPCVDQPQEHLSFDSSGSVSGISDRGRHTIEILGLNRPSLVQDRQSERRSFQLALQHKDRKLKSQLLDERAPYLAVKRQVAEKSVSRTVSQTAKREQRSFDAAREEVATDTKRGLEHFRSRSRYIERLEIENVASIEKLELNFEKSASDRTPCFALLGINGVGKSTVLRAIALALGGAAYAQRLRLDAKQLLRNRKKRGRVRVWVGGYSDPLELHITPKGFEFSSAHPRALVLAYGASRLLPTMSHEPREGMPHAKIDNMFDPFLPLTDAEGWLRGVAAAQFDDAARTIRTLLPVEDTATFVRARKGARLSVRFGSHDTSSFAQLSDGYQAVLGLAADILAILYSQGYKSARAGQATVLIDELGNHQHPQWKLHIVQALRQAFPQIQFIYSTHDPLCLRGLQDGEVAVLARDARRRVYALEDLPSISGLRVDQLLTSEHFGLDSATDPALDSDMKRYRELSILTRRSAAQQREYEELKRRLTDVRLLASSRRERLMLEAIDQELATPVPTAKGTVRAARVNARAVKRARQVLGASVTAARMARRRRS